MPKNKGKSFALFTSIKLTHKFLKRQNTITILHGINTTPMAVHFGESDGITRNVVSFVYNLTAINASRIVNTRKFYLI